MATHCVKICNTQMLIFPETISRGHGRIGRPKPGCEIVESVTTVWSATILQLTTEANHRSLLHCAVMWRGITPDHVGS